MESGVDTGTGGPRTFFGPTGTLKSFSGTWNCSGYASTSHEEREKAPHRGRLLRGWWRRTDLNCHAKGL